MLFLYWWKTECSVCRLCTTTLKSVLNPIRLVSYVQELGLVTARPPLLQTRKWNRKSSSSESNQFYTSSCSIILYFLFSLTLQLGFMVLRYSCYPTIYFWHSCSRLILPTHLQQDVERSFYPELSSKDCLSPKLILLSIPSSGQNSFF